MVTQIQLFISLHRVLHVKTNNILKKKFEILLYKPNSQLILVSIIFESVKDNVIFSILFSQSNKHYT